MDILAALSSRQPQRKDTAATPARRPAPRAVGPSAIASGAPPAPADTSSLQAEWGRNAGVLALQHSRAPTRAQNTQTAPQSHPVGPSGVSGPAPVQAAADVTGAPRGFLDALIGHESGGDPNARASTSSATGHAQFIDSTWLKMLEQYGPQHGLGATPGLTGLDRQAQLDLRTNPEWAAIMAGHYANENAAALSGALGRRVREGEVYLAHFLGPRDAASLLRASDAEARDVRRSPREARRFVNPKSVEANRSIFYDERGHRWRTAREVVALQTRNFSRDTYRAAPVQR
jgi:hypothetical protein